MSAYCEQPCEYWHGGAGTCPVKRSPHLSHLFCDPEPPPLWRSALRDVSETFGCMCLLIVGVVGSLSLYAGIMWALRQCLASMR